MLYFLRPYSTLFGPGKYTIENITNDCGGPFLSSSVLDTGVLWKKDIEFYPEYTSATAPVSKDEEMKSSAEEEAHYADQDENMKGNVFSVFKDSNNYNNSPQSNQFTCEHTDSSYWTPRSEMGISPDDVDVDSRENNVFAKKLDRYDKSSVCPVNLQTDFDLVARTDEPQLPMLREEEKEIMEINKTKPEILQQWEQNSEVKGNSESE